MVDGAAADYEARVQLLWCASEACSNCCFGARGMLETLRWCARGAANDVGVCEVCRGALAASCLRAVWGLRCAAPGW